MHIRSSIALTVLLISKTIIYHNPCIYDKKYHKTPIHFLNCRTITPSTNPDIDQPIFERMMIKLRSNRSSEPGTERPITNAIIKAMAIDIHITALRSCQPATTLRIHHNDGSIIAKKIKNGDAGIYQPYRHETAAHIANIAAIADQYRINFIVHSIQHRGHLDATSRPAWNTESIFLQQCPKYQILPPMYRKIEPKLTAVLFPSWQNRDRNYEYPKNRQISLIIPLQSCYVEQPYQNPFRYKKSGVKT